MNLCPTCGKNLTLVGRRHNCVTVLATLNGAAVDAPVSETIAEVEIPAGALAPGEPLPSVTIRRGRDRQFARPFLLQLPETLMVRIEAERIRRGLRSRSEAIRALLEESLK